MARTKKATSVIERRTSEEAKRAEELSLFFAAGERIRLENVVTEDDKPAIIQMYALDGEGKRHLVNVPTQRQDDGALEFAVPDLYPDDGPEVYLICGIQVEARSFTSAEYLEWRDLAEERKLAENFAKRQKLRNEVVADVQTGDLVDTINKRLPNLRKARDKFLEKESEAFWDFDVEDEKKLKLVNTRIAGLEAELKGLEKERDPEEIAVKLSPKGREIEQLKLVYQEASLEFVHRLAMRRGDTKDSWESWKETATGDDYANADAVVAEGNAYWVFGKAAQALNRQGRRKLARAARTLN